jgi:UDP-glucose 4-epimerase
MKLKSKNILITGGAGFIGSHLTEEYLKENIEKLVVYDNFSTGYTSNLSHIKDDRLKIVKADVLDRDALNRCIKREKIQVINHLAAELEVYTGIKDVHHDAQINIFGTLNVLDAALKNRVEKVLFASSGGIYGQAHYTPQDENHPWNPHWPYGVAKLAAERYARQYWQLHGLPTVSFRYAIIYGYREWYGRVLPMFIKRIFIQNKPPVIFGKGDQRRDYLNVKDVVRAHLLAAKNDKVNGMVFNLGTASGVSIKELALLLIKLSGKKFTPIFDDPKQGSASKLQPGRIRLIGELQDFILDNARAQKHLGWAPHVIFREGLTLEIEWILKNKKRWDMSPRV